MNSEGNTAVFTDTPIGEYNTNHNPIYNRIVVYDKEGNEINSCSLPITTYYFASICRPRIDSGKLAFVLSDRNKKEWVEADLYTMKGKN